MLRWSEWQEDGKYSPPRDDEQYPSTVPAETRNPFRLVWLAFLFQSQNSLKAEHYNVVAGFFPVHECPHVSRKGNEK